MAKQSRNFVGELYPDSTDYVCEDILGQIKNTFEFWAFALHDKDTFPDGTPKKPHYHWVGTFDTPRTLDAVARKLGVEARFIEWCHSVKKSVRYLIHLDHRKTKYLYSPDIIESSVEVFDYLEDKDGSEALDVTEIINYIFEHNVKSIATLVQWCAMNGKWSTYRRAQSTFIAIIRERNAIMYIPELPQQPEAQENEKKGEQVEWTQL